MQSSLERTERVDVDGQQNQLVSTKSGQTPDYHSSPAVYCNYHDYLAFVKCLKSTPSTLVSFLFH